MMKVRFIGNSDPMYFIYGQIYDVLKRETENLYRIIDETGEDYCYTLDDFEIVR
ncbi:hypothetical protein ACOI1C_21430 [Bacillus sp. DJP31]|uniref:hypothetical protein n=1 Tax=Bacillus sp. DJP31 TaxID=3409789 RepID=UPI003BB4D23E